MMLQEKKRKKGLINKFLSLVLFSKVLFYREIPGNYTVIQMIESLKMFSVGTSPWWKWKQLLGLRLSWKRLV